MAVAVAAATHGNIHSYMREKMTESGIGEEIGKSTAAAAKEETRMREESIWHQACEQKVTGTGRKRRDWDEREMREHAPDHWTRSLTVHVCVWVCCQVL